MNGSLSGGSPEILSKNDDEDIENRGVSDEAYTEIEFLSKHMSCTHNNCEYKRELDIFAH